MAPLSMKAPPPARLPFGGTAPRLLRGVPFSSPSGGYSPGFGTVICPGPSGALESISGFLSRFPRPNGIASLTPAICGNPTRSFIHEGHEESRRDKIDYVRRVPLVTTC